MGLDHARLSASGAYRWMECTPSANLEAHAEEQQSIYAFEGTVAHALAERLIRAFMEYGAMLAEELYQDTYAELHDNPLFKNLNVESIHAEVMPYVDYVCDLYKDLKANYENTTLFLERRLDFSKWVPEGFGTGDCIIISKNELYFVDLKFGKGKRVEAHENKQLMLYALGALQEVSDFADIETVHMTIHQPRIDNVSTFTMSATDLLEWADNTLKPIAQKAFNGEGEFVPGDHCQFCKVKNCRALQEHSAEVALKAFAAVEKLPTLSLDETADILNSIDIVEIAIKSIKDYALAQALQGKKVHGYKLVEGVSRRKITDEEKAIKDLEGAGLEKSDITKTTLLGLTDLEKALKPKKLKLDEVLGDNIVKPSGAPTLVTEDDKRPEMSLKISAEEAFKDVDLSE